MNDITPPEIQNSCEPLQYDHSNEHSGISDFLKMEDDEAAFIHWVQSCSKTRYKNDITLDTWISNQIAIIDDLVNEQVSAILHNEKFQQLESSWRNLWFLVDSRGSSTNIKIKLLDLSWRMVSKDVQRAPDYDQSNLFHLIYSEEFGRPGGEPFGVIIGDYYVSHKSTQFHKYDDIFTLQELSKIAAAAFCPFICSASPNLFGLDSYENLTNAVNIEEIFKSQEYERWNTLRNSENSRFLAITMPQVLLRAPYNKILSSSGNHFTERMDHKKYSRSFLWGNSAFALGTVLIREFREVGWFSHIRGAPRDHIGGGLVTQYPSLSYKADTTPNATKMFTSIVITDKQEKVLAEQGLISICHSYQTQFATINSCPSLQNPPNLGRKSANANARINSMLQQILCGSRFAQYIKVMIREKIGTYTGAQDLQTLLQNWLDKYSTGRDDLSWEMLARYPLRDAKVIINEDPNKPGFFFNTIYLKSHYNVENLVSELKLTTSISQIGTLS